MKNLILFQLENYHEYRQTYRANTPKKIPLFELNFHCQNITSKFLFRDKNIIYFVFTSISIFSKQA